MMRILQLLDEVFYGLGILGLVAGVILKLGWVEPHLLADTSARSSLIFAGVMFLAVIATKSIATDAPSS